LARSIGKTLSTIGRGRGLWVAAVVVAVLVMVSGVGAWWQAAHDEQLESAKSRDTVLMQAQNRIETMNTLDYRKVDEGLKAWAGATTGTLHDSLKEVDDEDRKLLKEQKKISTGEVLDAAVSELSEDSATVLAAVEVSVTDGEDKDAEPTVKRNRFSADLVKTSDGWKLEALNQVPVNLS